MYLRTVPGVPPVEPGRDEGCLFGEGVPFTVPGKNQIKLDYDIKMFFFVGLYLTELSTDQGKHWRKIIQRILLPLVPWHKAVNIHRFENVTHPCSRYKVVSLLIILWGLLEYGVLGSGKKRD